MRGFSAAMLWLGWASAASAASLTVTPDKLTYTPGETITLTILGDNAAGGAYGIYGRLLYNGALVDNGTRSQITLMGPGAWVKGPLIAGDTNTNSPTSAFSEAFNQLTLTEHYPTNLPGIVSTVTLIASASGLVDVNWNTATGSGFELSFFGLTNAPGASFTIVPEPATLVLVGIGLTALAARQHRRIS